MLNRWANYSRIDRKYFFSPVVFKQVKILLREEIFSINPGIIIQGLGYFFCHIKVSVIAESGPWMCHGSIYRSMDGVMGGRSMVRKKKLVVVPWT